MSNLILVPLDGSSLADAAIPHAAELARRIGGGLHLVRVHTPVTLGLILDAPAFVMDPDLEADARKDLLAWLRRRENEVRTETRLPVTSTLRIGTPAKEIVAAAVARDAKLIVCTTHGVGGWAPHWLGSVADDVLRHAPCPVLAMSEPAAARSPIPASMLVLLDGSAVSATILPAARWFAEAFGARVELLRVVEPPWMADSYSVVLSGSVDRFDVIPFADTAKRRLDETAEQLRTDGLAVTSVVEVEAAPVRAILEHIEQANPDIVALATYGRGLSRLFMGSVADKLLRTAARPTLCFCPKGSVIEAAADSHEDELSTMAAEAMRGA